MNEIIYPPYSDPIDEMSGQFRTCQILLVAVRLALFSRIANAAKSAKELAAQLSVDTRALQILCDSLASTGLLLKDGQKYRNSELALEYLTEDAPKCRIGILKHQARCYAHWGRLFDVVKSGKSVKELCFEAESDENEQSFAQAMADIGRQSAKKVVDLLDLSGVSKLLDVGGGPGIYASEFARKNPNLHVTVLDTKDTLEVAQVNVGEAGFEDRITLEVGDIFEGSIDPAYDFIFLSNIVHIYSFEKNQGLITRLTSALSSSGRLCIKDFVLSDDRITPNGAALFAVNMLVHTEKGDCYTLSEIKTWFAEAGLMFQEHLELTPQSSMVIGKKN